ncbi:UPF0551 protein C8orf38 [Morus notabilis]|uniref:UPF0551 protein C8orf38 n=1 Tax=Morus notabilis TaxID=981085 RepID=W9QU32_9ROSA|nr:UPF0551 protein C8orf38 [Morus notabilis]
MRYHGTAIVLFDEFPVRKMSSLLVPFPPIPPQSSPLLSLSLMLVVGVAAMCNCSKSLMNGAFQSSSLQAAFSYCAQQVRSYDYHHYLCLLELPPNMRKAAFAIRAFNIETARAMDVASDPKIGLMRLKLGSMMQGERSLKFQKKIEELERYAEDTASTILYTTLQAGGVMSTELITQHHILGDRSEINLDSQEKICNVMFDMASVANVHLQKARGLAETVPAEARQVLLPAVPAQVLLDSLRWVHFDVFDPWLAKGVLGLPPLWFQLRLKWHSWRGKY